MTKKNRLSLLEQMRNSREMRESEDVKYYRDMHDASQARAIKYYYLYQDVQKILKDLEQALSKEFSKYLLQDIAEQMTNALMLEFYKALERNPPSPDFSSDVYITIPRHRFLGMDRDSIVQLMIAQYNNQKYSPRVEFTRHQTGTHMRVTIPQLNYDRVIWDQ